MAAALEYEETSGCEEGLGEDLGAGDDVEPYEGAVELAYVPCRLNDGPRPVPLTEGGKVCDTGDGE